MKLFSKRFSQKRNAHDGLSGGSDQNPRADAHDLSSDELQDAVEAATQPTDEFSEVWIEPDSELTQSQSLLAKRKIDSESFVIGRRGSGYISSTHSLPDFALAQHEPYTVSKRHCEIGVTDEGVVVRDLESRYGTIVDGIRLGGRRPELMELHLGPGVHTLVIGPRNSNYRFRITVQ